MKAQSMERQRKGHTPNPQTSSKPPPLWGGFPRMKRGSGFSFDSFGSVVFYFYGVYGAHGEKLLWLLGSVEFYDSTEDMEYMENVC